MGSFSFKGAAVGNMVGAPVNGALVLGADVGNVVGSIVGEEVGVVVGAADGAAVGDVGLDDGAAETGAAVGAEVTGAAVGAPVAANLRRCAPIEPFVTTTETARVANRRRRRPYSATSAWIRIVIAPIPSYCATHEEIPIAGMN